MKQKGMGRTRAVRFAAVTIPATVAAAGLGFAVVQGMVGATLASSTGFVIQSDRAGGSQMELTASGVGHAASDQNDSSANGPTALVSLKGGAVSNMCLGADTKIPLLNTYVGLKIGSSTPVNLGSGWTELNAGSLSSGKTVLPQTDIGYAVGGSSITEQLQDPAQSASATGNGAPGGFSLGTDVTNSSGVTQGGQPGNSGGAPAANTAPQITTNSFTPGSVDIDNLDANVYSMTMSGLTLNSMSIKPTLGGVFATPGDPSSGLASGC